MNKKETLPLTNEEKKSYHKQKIYYISKKEFFYDDITYFTVRDHYTPENAL